MNILDLACVRRYLVTPAAANELGLKANPAYATVGDAAIQLYLLKTLVTKGCFTPGELTAIKQRVLSNKSLATFVDNSNLLQWWTLEASVIKGKQTLGEYYIATLVESTVGALFLHNQIRVMESLLDTYFVSIIPDVWLDLFHVAEPVSEDGERNESAEDEEILLQRRSDEDNNARQLAAFSVTNGQASNGIAIYQSSDLSSYDNRINPAIMDLI